MRKVAGALYHYLSYCQYFLGLQFLYSNSNTNFVPAAM